MFCNIMFKIVASELINFEINYPYMYLFGRSSNTWMRSLSNVILILGMAIMPNALPSGSRIFLSTLQLKYVRCL